MTEASPLRDRVVRMLGRLTEITRILDRNREDAAFVRDLQNGPTPEIFYVFDTNIVQTFIEPFRNPQFAETFHSGIWGRDYQAYDAVNMQACLLTAEFLFSGMLPGQRKRAWYMSTHHYHELRLQLERIVQDAKENQRLIALDPTFLALVSAPLVERKELLELDPAKDGDRLLEMAARLEERTRAELQQMPREAIADLSIAIRDREICRVMTEDRVFEPVNQYRRLQSRQIMGHMRPLEQAFRPTRDDLRTIEDEKESWKAYLLNAIHDRPRGARSPKALDNDCATLAHISWAQRYKAEPHQRIVLVTGDKALYDAYRRRHVEEADGLPFLLRPVTQYAPLFNPLDAGSFVADRDEGFVRIREAVEAATVALNLGLFNSAADSESKVRARDHFILESEASLDRASWMLARWFPRFFDEEWLKAQDRNLHSVVRPLQRAERLMLGAYPNLLSKRLEDQQRELLDAAKRGDGQALSQAMELRMQEAQNNGFYFSLPMMPLVVANLVNNIRGRDHPVAERASPTVRLRFVLDSKVLSLHELVEELGNREDDLEDILQELAERPARLFALASMLAFSLELWNEAARFADLAASASEHSRQSDPRDETFEDHHEYLYLKATSLRFRLAGLEPNPEKLFFDPWAQWLSEAEAALNDCIEHHGEHQQYGRLVRAHSELASARLTYCAWFAFGRLGDLRVHDGEGGKVARELGLAVEALAACEELIPKAAERAERARQGGRSQAHGILEAATRQCQVNVLAARLVAQSLVRGDLVTAAEADAALADLPAPREIEEKGLPTIAKAYLRAREGDLARLRALSQEDFTLALDGAIVAGLAEMCAEGVAVPA